MLLAGLCVILAGCGSNGPKKRQLYQAEGSLPALQQYLGADASRLYVYVIDEPYERVKFKGTGEYLSSPESSRHAILNSVIDMKGRIYDETYNDYRSHRKIVRLKPGWHKINFQITIQEPGKEVKFFPAQAFVSLQFKPYAGYVMIAYRGRNDRANAVIRSLGRAGSAKSRFLPVGPTASIDDLVTYESAEMSAFLARRIFSAGLKAARAMNSGNPDKYIP